MALDEPRKDDKVIVINEIQVAIESIIADDIDGLVVEYDHGRHAIVLSGNDDDCD